MSRTLGLTTLCLAVLTLAACISRPLGPQVVQVDSFDYNEAISRTWDEQMLLNLVRLRYRDNPLFLDINSVTSSYSLSRNASASTDISGNPLDLARIGAGAGISLNDNPVINFSYLRGNEFTNRMLAPLSLTELRALARSGWSIERLLLCCMESVNSLENAQGTTGPTPDYVPDFREYQRMARLARELQLAHAIRWEYTDQGASVRIEANAGPGSEEFRRLLKLSPAQTRFEVVAGSEGAADRISIQGRSLLGVMYFLSLAVDVPPEHRAAGKVTRTTDASDKEFDWSELVGDLMRIQSGVKPPADAAVQVHYRDHWFWIDDRDLNSKTTFSLLRLLLFLKAGDTSVMSPLVTIPSR